MPGNWIEPPGEKIALEDMAAQAHWQREYHRILREMYDAERAGLEGAVEGETGTVGLRLPRNDVLYKVRGRARYAANIKMEGMLHCRFVRSEHAHARILAIDTSKAEIAPGVVAVLTGADIPPEQRMTGTLTQDTPVLAVEKVRFAGEPIVAIAAETPEAAEAACYLVDVTYEPLPTILSPEQALAPDAEQVDAEGNVIGDLLHELGDAQAGLVEADVVIENEYTIESMDHCFLEPPSGLSFVDPEGVLTILVCTQYPHYHHKQVARVTGLPMEKVRVAQTVVGGAFGGKMDNTVECAIALLTLKTGHPVSAIFSREEVFTATTKRHAMKIRQKMGATRDGRLTALDVDVLADGGAYRSYSMIVGGRCVIHTGMPYRIPNVRSHYLVTFTNYPPAGAMRSFGIVKMAFALESQMNEMADRLGMSPIEFRRINAMVDDDQTIIGQKLWDVGFLKTLDAIEPIYQERKREIAANPTRNGRKRGVGLASLGYGIGYSGVRNPSTARMRVAADGSVVAYCGTPDIGTGSDMSLAMIAAQSAGISLHRVRVISGDSTQTDDSGPTSASRTTYFSGNAAYICGQDFKRQIEAAVARKRDVPPERVQLADDRVIVGNDGLSFEQACTLIADEIEDIYGYGKFDPDIAMNILTFSGNPYATYTFGTDMVEVEVDEELGRVEVVRCWTAHDAGTVINPTGTEGQIDGGVVMGIGQALWERCMRKDGIIANPHYRDYLLPGVKDVPFEIQNTFVENKDRTGPYGAKGVAEVSLIPIPAAIGAAVMDAVGVRPDRLPMDAEYLYRQIAARQDRRCPTTTATAE